nr:Fic family protein [Candidatus Sigynarchaeota archaeon]
MRKIYAWMWCIISYETTKTIHGKTYQYLRHNYRKGPKSRSVEMGITKYKRDGRLDVARDEFIQKVFDVRWREDIEKIGGKHGNEMAKASKIAREKYLDQFGYRFTFNTNKIEGSTLSMKDTRDIIVLGLTPKNKPVEDVIETKAHMAVYKDMLDEHSPLSRDLILKWHERLFVHTKPNIAGSFRKTPVMITGSKYLPPASGIEVEYMLDQLWKWHEQHQHAFHPVLLAASTSYRFVSIHPFDDGNGRVSRLMMNFILHHAGYPMFNINHVHRGGYYNALESAQVNKDELHYLVWFFRRYIDENKDYL